MPLLGGLFSRKNKASRNSDATSSSAAAASAAASDFDDGSTLSPTSSYVSPDRYLPSSPNGKMQMHPSSAAAMSRENNVYPSAPSGASSSKLRLFGRRKKSHLDPSTSSTSVNTTYTLPNYSSISPPRPSYANRVSTSSTVVSDAESGQDTRRLRPPPSKSAIFAAYGDPSSALSTRSLPAQPRRDEPPSPPLPALPPEATQVTKKERPSIFPWSKSSPSTPTTRRNNAKEPPPVPQLSPVEPQRDSSFNLKSFRHVRAPSPSPNSPASTASPSTAHNPNASNTSLTPPTRPRGASINSESSQRISVAAFREAQARRSLAGSPVLGRSPSPGVPSPAGRRPPVPAPRRLSTGPVGYPSSSDESPSPSEDEDDSGEDYTQRPGGLGRKRTITSRSQAHHAPASRPGKAKKAQSELGHGMMSSSAFSASRSPATSPSSRSHAGHGSPMNSPGSATSTSYTQVVSAYTQPLRGGDDSDRENEDRKAHQRLMPPRSQSSMSHYGSGTRTRASASTSAASPSPAAKRASMTVAIGGVTGNNLGSGISDAVSNYKHISRHVRGSSTYSNPAAPPSSPPLVPPMPKPNNNSKPALASRSSDDSDGSESKSDTDSDDAPLATLLPPRRPGSAMSSYSTGSRTGTGQASRSNSNLPATNLPPPSLPRSNNVRSNSNAPAGPAKPLIDIAELTSRPPRLTSGAAKNNDDAFTGGGTLLGGKTTESPASSPNMSLLSTSPPSLGLGLTSRYPPAKFISPPASPAKEIKAASYFDVREKEPGKSAGFSSFTASPVPVPERKGTGADVELSQNQKRDMISERLSRAVKDQLVVAPTAPPGTEERGKGEGVDSDSTSESSESESDDEAIPPVPVSRSREGSSPAERETSPLSIARSKGESQGRGLSVPRSIQTSTPSPTPSSGPTPRTSVDVLSSMSNGSHKPSPPDEDLASMLGAGINLISRGDSDSEWESEEEEERREREEEEEEKREREEKMKEESIFLPPIPIKERAPPPAFSVTSRPQHPRTSVASVSSMATFIASPLTTTSPTTTASTGVKTRQRSSTLVPSSTSSTFTFTSPISPSSSANLDQSTLPNGNIKTSGSSSTITPAQGTTRPGIGVRQRSTTMVPISSPTASKAPTMPSKPFAAPQRRDSPASSTGDSSSGRAPLTPRDGSEIGTRRQKAPKVGKEKEKAEWSSGVSGLGAATTRHVKRKSVNFNDDDGDFSGSVKGNDVEVAASNEERRNERRRREARAAIELGNDINGRGPVVDEDDDDDMPINQALNTRMSAVNPMMAMPMQQQPAGWPNMNMWPQQPGGTSGMLSPAQFMLPPPQSNDVAFLAAHQQAMMFAKQAYQMAVAQQAMAAAADEWERGSTYGGGAASVYGAPSSASVMNMPMNPPFGMMGGMGMMGMPGMGGGGVGMGNGWSTGSTIFPPSSRSVYGGAGPINSSRSEYGGGGGGGNWSSSRTSYGEFGPSANRISRAGASRESGYFPPMPPIPRDRDRDRESSSRGAVPRSRTASQPANPRPGTGQRKAQPPSSWKASGA